MSDEQLREQWRLVFREIRNDSPYTFLIGNEGIVLVFKTESEPTDPDVAVGVLRSPLDWTQLRQEVVQLGQWPTRMQFAPRS